VQALGAWAIAHKDFIAQARQSFDSRAAEDKRAA
jgi:hypothetical protein